MATDPRRVLTALHGREIGLNHERKLVVKGGYVIEGTPTALLVFNDDGLAVEVLPALIQLSDGNNIVPVDTDPVLVTFDSVDEVENMTYSNGTITIDVAGTYMIIVGGQVGKATGSNLRHLDMWLKLNDVDMPRSSVRQGLTNVDTTVVVTSATKRLAVGDELQVWIKTPDADGSIGLYAVPLGSAPLVPSIILSILKSI